MIFIYIYIYILLKCTKNILKYNSESFQIFVKILYIFINIFLNFKRISYLFSNVILNIYITQIYEVIINIYDFFLNFLFMKDRHLKKSKKSKKYI